MDNESSPVEIRLMGPEDAAAFREVRLLALSESPQAFAMDYRGMENTSPEQIAERFRTQTTAGDNFVVGAFREGKLVGMAGFRRDTGEKTMHKGLVWGVYVAPEGRGRGIGHRLMLRCLEQARTVQGLEQIYLAVSASQEPARRLYRSLGFTVYGVEPRALKVDGVYRDEELMVLMLDSWEINQERGGTKAQE